MGHTLMRVFTIWIIVIPLVALSNERDFRQQLVQQLPTLWESYRPVCLMALPADLQIRASKRLQWLDNQMLGSGLATTFERTSAPVLTLVWRQNAWKRMQKIEQNALSIEQREDLRNYYYLLQENQPSRKRQSLIQPMTDTVKALNLALRRGIWKTCQTLAWDGLANEQLEAALGQRWKPQGKAVEKQLQNELATFLFFSYRQISNKELAQFTNLHKQIKPWVEALHKSIDQYFIRLRQRLVQQPLLEPKRTEAGAPFPPSRPLSPTLSQPQPQLWPYQVSKTLQ